jgi:hypothetical protein
MVVALDDGITVTDLALAAYERAVRVFVGHIAAMEPVGSETGEIDCDLSCHSGSVTPLLRRDSVHNVLGRSG